MVTRLSPLADNVPIVDKDGNPTPYFQRMLDIWLKEKAVAEGDLATVITDVDTLETTVANLELDDLADVDVSTTPPDDGQTIVWDEANSEWVPGDAGGGGSGGDLGVLHLRDLRAASTDAGTFTSGAWQPRPLTTSAYNDITGATYHTSTVTITIATPGVITWTAHGLVAGTPVVFTTTGALPTGLTAGTVYYVIAAGLAADSFQVSATSGGAAVNTSGTQSGTHTAYSNQFSLPAGTYDVFISCPAHQVETHQARLQNLTDATTAALGTTARTRNTSSTDGTNDSTIRTRFTIAGTKRFEVQHRCATTLANTGLGTGSANSWGSVVFTDVFIRAVSVLTPPETVGEWQLLSTWDHSVSGNTASITSGDLTGYKEAMVVFEGSTVSSSGNRGVQVSVDGGTNFLNTSSDYRGIDDATSGAVNNEIAIYVHSTASTGSRGGFVIINLEPAGVIKPFETPTRSASGGGWVNTTSAINRIRAANYGTVSGTGPVGTLNSGKVHIFVR